MLEVCWGRRRAPAPPIVLMDLPLQHVPLTTVRVVVGLPATSMVPRWLEEKFSPSLPTTNPHAMAMVEPTWVGLLFVDVHLLTVPHIRVGGSTVVGRVALVPETPPLQKKHLMLCKLVVAALLVQLTLVPQLKSPSATRQPSIRRYVAVVDFAHVVATIKVPQLV